jgi:RND family efflux transporter MFP subunit
MKKIVISILVLVAVVALGIKGKSLLQKRQAQVVNEALPAVEMVTVPVVYSKKGTLKHSQKYLAQITSDKSIKLSTKLVGYIKKVHVEESQMVKKGDVLVTIDDIEIRSNIDVLKATMGVQNSDLLLAKSIYKRNKKLYRIGGLSKEKLDISKLSLQSKEAIVLNSNQKIVQLKHQLTYLKVTAPFDGVVDTVLMHEGDLASIGKPILSMSNGKKKLVFSYAQNSKASIGTDQTVLIDNKKVGYIKAIYTTSKNGLTSAEIALVSPIGLPTGSSLNIDVLTKEAQGCILPKDTILHKKTGTFIMTYKNASFKAQKVHVVMQKESEVIISPCPKTPVAQASEVKLATLPAYDKVEVIGESYGQ